MTTHKAAYGPIAAETFAELVSAPYGKAAEVIRKFDPFWGKSEGENVKFRVTLEGSARCFLTVTVGASSKEEAEKLAFEQAETDASDEWDYDEPDEYYIARIEPA